MIDATQIRSILSEGLLPNQDAVDSASREAEGLEAGSPGAPAPEGQEASPGKPDEGKASTPVATPATSSADPLDAEYGSIGDRLGETPQFYQEQATVLARQVEELRNQVEYFQNRSANKLAALSQEEVEAKAAELREQGKLVEAEKMVRQWMDAANETPEQYLARRGAKANAQLEEYFKAQPALKNLLQRPDVSRALYRYVGLINMDRPGAPELLHAVCMGLCYKEIARKAEERGRQSVTIKPPKSVATNVAENPPQARSDDGRFRPKTPVSELLLAGKERL
jgi:hypothetical protein